MVPAVISKLTRRREGGIGGRDLRWDELDRAGLERAGLERTRMEREDLKRFVTA